MPDCLYFEKLALSSLQGIPYAVRSLLAKKYLRKDYKSRSHALKETLTTSWRTKYVKANSEGKNSNLRIHVKSATAKMMKFPGPIRYHPHSLLVRSYRVTKSVTASQILEVVHRHALNTGDLNWLFHLIFIFSSSSFCDSYFMWKKITTILIGTVDSADGKYRCIAQEGFLNILLLPYVLNFINEGHLNQSTKSSNQE